MRFFPIAFALGFLTLVAAASQLTLRKFVFLGDQTFEHLVSGDDPAAAENELIKVVAAGFVPDYAKGRDSRIHGGFGFSTKQPLKIRQVIVEEVSGREPILLIRDTAPKLNKNSWVRNATARLMNEVESPWLYAAGDDRRVFRFSISTADHGIVVLLQPARMPEQVKQAFIAQAAETKVLPAQRREWQYVAAAFSVVKSGFKVNIMPLVRNTGRPDPELVDLIKQSKPKKVVQAIGTEHEDWASEILRLTLASVEPGSLKGYQLIVVAPKPDAKAFAQLGQNSGLTISVAELAAPIPDPSDKAP